MTKGKIYMIPMTMGGEDANWVIPSEVQEKTKSLRCFIVENIKTTRRYLRSIDKSFPIDDSQFFELNKRTRPEDLFSFIRPAIEGQDIGVLSEAGCPGVADPGSEIVNLAHQNNLQVVPFVGPSSILMGLMASGFNGQQFCFHGYLPKERKDRIQSFKKMERNANSGETQIFMDTPYRNQNVLEDLLGNLKESTRLCIAANITTDKENIQTKSIADWKKRNINLDKIPTMFLIGQ